MKIEIEIDDRYAARNLYIFAGLELVAKRQQKAASAERVWERKVDPCIRCGLCCAAIRSDHTFGSDDGCIHLDRRQGEQLCSLGIFRPHGCAIADGHQVGIESCKIRWETVE